MDGVQPIDLYVHFGHRHPRQRLYPLGDMATHGTALAADVAGIVEFESDPYPGVVMVHRDRGLRGRTTLRHG